MLFSKGLFGVTFDLKGFLSSGNPRTLISRGLLRSHGSHCPTRPLLALFTSHESKCCFELLGCLEGCQDCICKWPRSDVVDHLDPARSSESQWRKNNKQSTVIPDIVGVSEKRSSTKCSKSSNTLVHSSTNPPDISKVMHYMQFNASRKNKTTTLQMHDNTEEPAPQGKTQQVWKMRDTPLNVHILCKDRQCEKVKETIYIKLEWPSLNRGGGLRHLNNTEVMEAVCSFLHVQEKSTWTSLKSINLLLQIDSSICRILSVNILFFKFDVEVFSLPSFVSAGPRFWLNVAQTTCMQPKRQRPHHITQPCLFWA